METTSDEILEAGDRVRVARSRESWVQADVLYASPDIVVLQARLTLPKWSVGADVRLLKDNGQAATGRIASFGQGGRFLVTLGSRAIRRSARRKLDIPAVVWAGSPLAAYPATILDVSRTGARLEGLKLVVGSELALRFTPPGSDHEFTLRGIVVRQIPTAEEPEIGIAFTVGSEINLPD